MTIEIIIVHPPDYNEQANLPVVSLLSLRKKDGLSMGFEHNRVLRIREYPMIKDFSWLKISDVFCAKYPTNILKFNEVIIYDVRIS